ncbi:MAG: antibiotic biosynthesis monooxygenase [Alphaproteobacteria bacterium]|nr:antibiotic biosynthesis monooxygenase [Alphaproteobacteria bacterium]
MQVVIFEVVIKEGKQAEYLDIAAQLRPILEGIDGFISVERFQSLSAPEKLLSLSFWRDAEAVANWRKQETHQTAQQKGNSDIFKDYRITVAAVERSYGLTDRAAAPQ